MDQRDEGGICGFSVAVVAYGSSKFHIYCQVDEIYQPRWREVIGYMGYIYSEDVMSIRERLSDKSHTFSLQITRCQCLVVETDHRIDPFLEKVVVVA